MTTANEEKIYTLYLSPLEKMQIFGMPTIFALGSVLSTLFAMTSPKDGPPRFIGLVFLWPVAFFLYFILSTPHKISFSKNSGEVIFISFLRCRQVLISEIISIKAGGHGILGVKTSRGKMRLYNQFDNFHDFLSNLKQANPLIELRGC